MKKRSTKLSLVLVVIMLFVMVFNTVNAAAATTVLKKGMRGTAVTKLQKDLKTLGYMSVKPTGYYGSITEAAVKKLQARYDISKTGKAGPQTQAKIKELLQKPAAATRAKAVTVSRGETDSGYLIPWYGKAEKIFAIGDKAKIYDIKSGLSFNIKRTYGYNHADCETLTKADTEILKKIYGGQWSWARRPVIVIVDGKKIAASMAGMPHAGLDNKPANQIVSGRSVGYGTGANLDMVKGNNMDGHFDIHFLGSRTHGTNSVNADHQEAVKEAAAWAEKNY